MSKQPNMTQHIEAALFVSSGPISTAEIAKKLSLPKEDVQLELNELEKTLQGRGICLVKSGSGYELAVIPQLRDTIAAFTGDSAPILSQSSLEVLTIIAYEGPCAKTTIDDIRGTPSDNSLRALMSRDLISQIKARGDEEGMRYELTSFAWRSLGITGRDALPPKPRTKHRGNHAS